MHRPGESHTGSEDDVLDPYEAQDVDEVLRVVIQRAAEGCA